MRIGIASSRSAAADLLRRAVTRAGGHHVVWTVTTGADAVERCLREAPDLVLMDLVVDGGETDGIDGVEATRQITELASSAVIIVTESVQANAARVFEAMVCGAIDAVDMPPERDTSSEGLAPLLAKIDTISRLVGRPRPAPVLPLPDPGGPAAHSLVAIGASAGGPPALAALLRGLPKDFPGAVVIVQHVDPQFALGMAAWLADQTPLPVRIAADGDRVTAGTVLLAGRNDHLVLTSPERLGYTHDAQCSIHGPSIDRPSIDVFFNSIIKHWRGEAVGVLLTGMGRDGAAGLKAMRTCGLYTIAQDEASSAVYGMPKAAAALDAAVDIVPIELIAGRLIQALGIRSLVSSL